MKNAKTALFLVAALGTTLSIGGCSSEDKTPENVGTGAASLRRMKSCDELAAELRSDAKAKLDFAIDRQIAMIREYDVNGRSPTRNEKAATSAGAAGPPMSAGDDSSATAGSAPTPSSGNGESASSSDAPTRAGSYSETNTQVQGVDEADFVKTDGKYIYLLHGSELRIVDAFPKESLKEVGKARIDGSPSEMFLDKERGEIVVYSQVNGTPIYKAAGVTPRDEYHDYYGYFGYGGGVAVDVGSAAEAPAPDSAPRDPGGSAGGTTYEPYRPLTKVTVLKLTGAATAVTSEFYFEGNYLSSRRVGAKVRTVLQGGAHGPAIKTYIEYKSEPKTADEYIALLEKLRKENHAILDAAQASEWLPYSFTKSGATVTGALAKCEDYYVPTARTTESGLTQITSLDLDRPADAPRTASIAGAADTVYSTEGALYLASRGWNQHYWTGGAVAVGAPSSGTSGSTGSGGGGEVAPAPEVSPVPAPTPASKNVKLQDAANIFERATVTENFTHVHKFDLAAEPGFASYVGSGTVPGQVKNQFSLDEYQGNLRIATTEQRSGKNGGSFNHVYVLGQSGSSLATLGDAGDLAKGEQIYSVRFLGARGYVVTFRQVDPLFALDLSNPAAPKVTGELKIPGFSEYMHPLDDTHLLTIGRDATTEGRQQGLALQIFDVTDPAKPVQQQKFVYDGSEYGSSEAEYDHKAFTFFAEKGLLAFPYYSYSNELCDGPGCSAGPKSTLEVFSVSAATGFAKLGALDASSFLKNSQNGYCGGYYGPSVRRGLFLEDTAYAISYGGIVAKKVTELAGAGVSTPLAPPVIPANSGYGSGSKGGLEPAPAVDCAVAIDAVE